MVECWNEKCVNNVRYEKGPPRCGIQEPKIKLFETRIKWSFEGIYTCESCKY